MVPHLSLGGIATDAVAKTGGSRRDALDRGSARVRRAVPRGHRVAGERRRATHTQAPKGLYRLVRRVGDAHRERLRLLPPPFPKRRFRKGAHTFYFTRAKRRDGNEREARFPTVRRVTSLRARARPGAAPGARRGPGGAFNGENVQSPHAGRGESRGDVSNEIVRRRVKGVARRGGREEAFRKKLLRTTLVRYARRRSRKSVSATRERTRGVANEVRAVRTRAAVAAARQRDAAARQGRGPEDVFLREKSIHAATRRRGGDERVAARRDGARTPRRAALSAGGANAGGEAVPAGTAGRPRRDEARARTRAQSRRWSRSRRRTSRRGASAKKKKKQKKQKKRTQTRKMWCLSWKKATA